jgi:signal transduction histidine kinase
MRRRAVLIFLISLFFCSLIPLSIMLNPNKEKPKFLVRAGVMDLSTWDATVDKRIKLDGEWAFYWKRLYRPTDFQPGGAALSQPMTWMKVPSTWNGKLVDGKPLPAFGYATYRMVLKHVPEHSAFALKKTNIRFSSAVYVNGKLLFQDGEPAADAAGAEPGNVPQIGFFSAEGHEVDIVIHAANYDYFNGGIPFSLYFGEQGAMAQLQQKNVAQEFSMLTILCTLALVCLICYLVAAFYRKRDITLLLYSFICLLYAVYHGLVGERPLLLFMSRVPFEVIYKMKDISSFVCFMLLTILFHQVSAKLLSARLTRVAVAVLGCFIGLAVFLPIRTYTEISVYIGISYELILIGLLWQAARFHVFSPPVKRLKSLLLFLVTLTINLYSVDAMLLGLSLKENLLLAQFYMVTFTVMIIFLIIVWFFDAYDEMDRMRLQLLRMDKMKDDFLSTTSHELKTPLNAIISIADTLLRGVEGPLTDNQSRNLAIVMGSGRRLTLLVNELLDYSKMKYGDFKLYPGTVDLRAVVDSVLRIHVFLLDGKPIFFENRVATDFPAVRADSNRLIQILHNLVGNAVQYSDSGIVSVHAQTIGGLAEIRVEDKGRGIPADMQQLIFEDYQQAERVNDEPSSGTGLGLSITRRLVELHGGTIQVTSAPGVGSVFRFTLPLDLTPVKQQQLREHPWEKKLPQLAVGSLIPYYPRSIPGRTDQWILVVDDDFANLQAMSNLMALEGYSMVAVHRGQLALDELTRRSDFLLVLLDIGLPDMTGYEVLKGIRTRFSLLELPVLMLTARNKSSEIRLSMESGANDYVEKPFEAEELMARVRRLIQLTVAVNEARESEIAFLRAQINPHFLYNALNAIAELCMDAPEQAEELTLQLSQYLRSSFDFKQLDSLTTLRNELKLVEAYVLIEKARFGDRLSMSYQIEADKEFRLPPLVLQPLVENAIRHGLMGDFRSGQVKLSAVRLANGEVRFTIEDDGQGMSGQKLTDLLADDWDKKGVGLSNIRKRIKLLYNREVYIDSHVGKGTRVWFDLPGEPFQHQGG